MGQKITDLPEISAEGINKNDVMVLDNLGDTDETKKITVEELTKALLMRAISFGGVITPAEVSTQQNDYAPTGHADATFWRLSAASPGHTITGVDGGVDGRVIFVHNVGSYPLLLKEESGASAAENRVALGPNGGNPALESGMAWILQYDGVLERWRILHLLKNATTTAPGLMSHTDKSKLDNDVILDGNFAGTSLGRLTRTGVGTYAVIKDNLVAATAPAEDDDSADGYSVGSLWFDIVAGSLYVCFDATVDASVWKPCLHGLGGEGASFASINAGSLQISPGQAILGDLILTNMFARYATSPSQITANQNNYAPPIGSARTVWRIESDASHDITGLSVSQVDGKLVMLFNVGAFNITLKHESGSSTAANRFFLTNASDYVLRAGGALILYYDDTSDRWRPILNVAFAAPSSVGTANSEGTGSAFARHDHTHNHDAQTDPTHHALATSGAHGFMSATDKTKLPLNEYLYEGLSLVQRCEFYRTVALDVVLQSGSGTGAGVSAVVGSGEQVASHFGRARLTTGTTNAGYYTLFGDIGSIAGSGQHYIGGGRLLHRQIVYIPTLSTGSEEYVIRAGAGNLASGGEPTNGVFFKYDRTVSTNWIARTANTSAYTTASGGTNVAVATGWWMLEFIINAAGTSVDFYVRPEGGARTLIGSCASNLPANNGFYPGYTQITKTAGTTPATVDVDYQAVFQEFTTARAA